MPHLIKRSSKRKLRTSGVLNEHAKVGVLQFQTFGSFGYRVRDKFQALFTAASAKGAGVQNQKLRAKRQRAFQFSAKSLDGLAMKLRRRAGQVDQITAMDRHGADAIFFPQTAHGITLRWRQRIRLPLPRAGRENLKRIGSQPIGPFHRHLNAASRRSMYADAPRARLWRLTFGPQQHILQAKPLAFLNGTRHGLSNSSPFAL